MILIIAVLAILLLIACAGIYGVHHMGVEASDLAEAYKKNWMDECATSSALRNEKHHEWERAELAHEEIQALKQEIHDLKVPKVSDVQQGPEETPPAESGHYVRTRQLTPADPSTYQAVFDWGVNGQRILEDLTMRFCKDAYVSDRHGGERETCLRLGQRQVVNHIISQINKANSYFSED